MLDLTQHAVCCITHTRLALAAPKIRLVLDVDGFAPVVRYAGAETVARILGRLKPRPVFRNADGSIDVRDGYGIHGLTVGKPEGEVFHRVDYTLDLAEFFANASAADYAILRKHLPPDIKGYIPETKALAVAPAEGPKSADTKARGGRRRGDSERQLTTVG